MQRPMKIRYRLKRGKMEITTYALGARGAKRRVGSVIIQPEDLRTTLDSPAAQKVLGLDWPTRLVV